MFVVTVVFEIKPDRLDEFMPLMMAQAKNSLEREENCLQFDVCTTDEKPGVVFLYEVYKTEADFAAHMETDHFRDFSARNADMVIGKSVQTYHRA